MYRAGSPEKKKCIESVISIVLHLAVQLYRRGKIASLLTGTCPNHENSSLHK